MKIPSALIEKMNSGQLVAFAGAGLSISAGFPSWQNLIIEILDQLKEHEPKSEKFKDALNDEILNPLEVLNKIEKNKEYAIEALEKIIRDKDSAKPTPSHKIIGQVTSKIITSNYDCLLEKALPNFEKIPFSNKYKVSKLSEYSNYVFKIHGDIHEPDKCVLFPNQYKALYDKNDQTPIFELKKIISDKSILFIGLSLTDPYINYVFDFISNLYSGFTPEHFIITTDKDRNWPNRITPIVIDSYDQTEDVLKSLIDGKNLKDENKKEIENELRSQIGVNEPIKITEALEYDLPPNSKFWVGRAKEIKNLSTDIFKVIFITGIGGQGKSALAAHYVRNCFDSKSFEFGDWRDFKEEANRFQTKLISVIKRVSQNKISEKELKDASNTELVDTFFRVLSDRRIVFVFDNVDSYIDLVSFTPTGGIKYFFQQALKVNHQSKFIFTCRPHIRETGPDFYQLTLDGLSESDCEEIFTLYNVPVNKTQLKELSSKAYKLTKGHPLWINLIAAQAVRGIKTVNAFIKGIEDKTDFNEEGFSKILSEKILTEVWNSLNDKQRTLLRSISETVKPETTSSLAHIIEPELNHNQFARALKVLKNLNLIEIKSSDISEDQLELHPLVKEFISSKFPQTERAKFITLLVKYYDSFIYILKPNLKSKMTLSQYQNWTSKVELQINKGDFKSALTALTEVADSIISAGFSEEYLRVAEKLFNTIDWKVAIENEYSYFHTQFAVFTNILTQFGKYSHCEELLNQYSSLIQGKSSHYLSYCSSKCYLLWYQENFKDAIEIGEYGVHLLEESNLTDNYALRHNLALAKRDSKVDVNVKNALNFFLKGEQLGNVINNINKELGGHFYGNIGKCLEYLDDKKNALTCYYISLQILFEDESNFAKLNIGYAASWIYNIQIHVEHCNQKNCLLFLRLSIINWEKSSPPRAQEMINCWNKLNVDESIKNEVNEIPEWKLIVECKEIAKARVSKGFQTEK